MGLIAMVNARGQEAAPFELLIAVVVMGFVILTGMYAMQQMTLQKCAGATNAKLEELKATIETVVDQKSPQSINFKLSGCFNPKEEKVRVTDKDNPQLCAEYCGLPKGICTLLEYVNLGESKIPRTILCLNIPPDTDFPSQEFVRGRCPFKSDEGYTLQNFRESVPQGKYLLINKTSVNDPSPVICAYRKEG